MRELCKVDEACGRSVHGYGMCHMHWKRWKNSGDPFYATSRGGVKGDGIKRGLPKFYKGDEITYNSAHRRVKDERGSASKYDCTICRNTAEDWAYDHNDANAKFSLGSPYSPDPTHYIPLCRQCHKRMDSTLLERVIK